MLDAIKEKIKAVKNELTENFRTHFHHSNVKNLNSHEINLPFINFNAGQEILNHYESTWHDIHSLTNENIARSNHVTQNLHNLHKIVENGAENYKQINAEISLLPKLSDQLTNIIAETVKLQGLCEEVESSLFYLELLCQTQDMENIKLEQKFQLAMYREKKLASFNITKRRLSDDFVKRKHEKDEINKQNLIDKQKILQKAVEKDLEIYKSTGHITNNLLEDFNAFQDETNLHNSITDLVNTQIGHKLATQLTFVDEYQPNLHISDPNLHIGGPSLHVDCDTNLHIDNNNSDIKNDAGGQLDNSHVLNSMNQSEIGVGEKDLQALEDFLAGVKLDDSGIVGDNNEE